MACGGKCKGAGRKQGAKGKKPRCSPVLRLRKRDESCERQRAPSGCGRVPAGGSPNHGQGANTVGSL